MRSILITIIFILCIKEKSNAQINVLDSVDNNYQLIKNKKNVLLPKLIHNV